MIDKNMISGVDKGKMAPLFSFNTIVDLDFGLINLVYDKYLDPSVFNVSFFDKKSALDILYETYNRRVKNPLKMIANEDVSDEKLDIFYKEFMENEIKDVYRYSITTDILNLIDVFNKSQTINPIIFCYSEEQIKILNKELKLAPNEKVLIESLSKKDLSLYKQFFVRNVEELEYFSGCVFKMFYISTLRCNFNDSGEDFKDEKLFTKIIDNRNSVGIFDIYKNNDKEGK